MAYRLAEDVKIERVYPDGPNELLADWKTGDMINDEDMASFSLLRFCIEQATVPAEEV